MSEIEDIYNFFTRESIQLLVAQNEDALQAQPQKLKAEDKYTVFL